MATVRVTAEHNTYGKRANALRCDVALAVRDLVIPGIYVGVWSKSVTIGPCMLDLPPEAMALVEAIDFGRPRYPLDFELPIPKNLLKPAP